MTLANFRGPFFVDIQYHSSFGPHRMQIPTLAWSPPAFGADFGLFTKWEGGQVDADLMVNDLVDVIVPFFTADTTFDNWTVFSQPTDTDPAVPVGGNSFTAKVGTDASGGWTQAVQNTCTWRSEAFGKSKLVFLDMASNGDFSKISTKGTSGIIFDLDAEYTNTAKGWSAQDNSRPATFIASTRTLNEKLRRSGRLT